MFGILLHEGNTVFSHIRDSIKCITIFTILNIEFVISGVRFFVAGGGGGGDGSDGGYGSDGGCDGEGRGGGEFLHSGGHNFESFVAPLACFKPFKD